jgi:hypothetical protein
LSSSNENSKWIVIAFVGKLKAAFEILNQLTISARALLRRHHLCQAPYSHTVSQDADPDPDNARNRVVILNPAIELDVHILDIEILETDTERIRDTEAAPAAEIAPESIDRVDAEHALDQYPKTAPIPASDPMTSDIFILT